MNDYIIENPVPKDSLDLLLYEIRMFEYCFVKGYSPKDFIDKNTRLESFLLHARNLMDFLENKVNGKDDILISEFRDTNGYSMAAIKVLLSSDIKQKINKHLSHLTKTRLKEKPSWNIATIKKSINQALIEFLEKVSESHFPTKAGRTKKDFTDLILT